MKTKTLIAAATTAVLATFGGAALAQTTVERGEVGFVFADPAPTKTRAEVTADLRAAKTNGDYARLNATRPTFAFAPSVKSRDEVRADVRDAAAHGELLDNDAATYFEVRRVASRNGRAG
jgi:hypothetical protein